MQVEIATVLWYTIVQQLLGSKLNDVSLDIFIDGTLVTCSKSIMTINFTASLRLTEGLLQGPTKGHHMINPGNIFQADRTIYIDHACKLIETEINIWHNQLKRAQP